MTDADPPLDDSTPRRARATAGDPTRARTNAVEDGDTDGSGDVTQPTPDSTPPTQDDGDDPSRHQPDAPSDDPPPPPPPAERPIPIGCHPFVFGIVAATIQLALTLYLMHSC